MKRAVAGSKMPKLCTVSNKLVTNRLTGELYFLNFSAKFFEASVSISGVGDITAEGVPEHSFAVILIDAITFTEHGKCVAAVVGRMFFDSQVFERVIHVFAKGSASAQEKISASIVTPRY